MALFCVINRIDHWKFGMWGLVKERTLDRAFICIEPGRGEWFDVNDLEFRQDVPERVWDTHYY